MVKKKKSTHFTELNFSFSPLSICKSVSSSFWNLFNIKEEKKSTIEFCLLLSWNF